MQQPSSPEQVCVDFRMKAHYDRASGSQCRRAQISRRAQDRCLKNLVRDRCRAHVELLYLLALAGQDTPRSFKDRAQLARTEAFLTGVNHSTNGCAGALKSSVGAFAASSAAAVVIEVDALSHAHTLPLGRASPYSLPS